MSDDTTVITAALAACKAAADRTPITAALAAFKTARTQGRTAETAANEAAAALRDGLEKFLEPNIHVSVEPLIVQPTVAVILSFEEFRQRKARKPPTTVLGRSRLALLESTRAKKLNPNEEADGPEGA